MATLSYVKFQRGSNEAYQSLKTLGRLDNDTLYFTYADSSDTTGSLYLGEKLISSAQSSLSFALNDLTDVEITSSSLANKQILLYNGSKWINTSTDSILSDVYTKSETDAAISAALTNVGNLSFRIVDSTSAIDTTAADAAKYIYLVSTSTTGSQNNYVEYMVINGALEKVGDWSVDLSDYVTIDDLDNYVVKEEGSRLITSTEIGKLDSIENGAQKNFITSVDIGNFSVSDEGKLNLTAVPASIITDLDDVVENFLFIKSVNTNEFTVTDVGQLNLNAVSLEKIEGYEIGSRLITQAEIDKLALIDPTIETVYVPQAVYHSEIGFLTDLDNYDEDNPTTIVDEINSINERLTWGDIT